jgi:hypothetical protein
MTVGLLGDRLDGGFRLTVVDGFELCWRDVGVVPGDLAVASAVVDRST